MRRRTYLTAGAGALTTAVAGCAGGGGGDGTPTGTETQTETERPTETGTPTGDGPALGDALTPETAFAYTATFEDPEIGAEGTVEGRFHEGDSYVSMTVEGETYEIYDVEDTRYVVFGDQCIEDPTSDVAPAGPAQDPEEFDEGIEEYRDLGPDGTRTVDGEEAYYWEVDHEGTQVTYYVSVSSGRLLRIEFPTGQIDYHSWGAVDPIEAPDVECVSP